MDTIVKLCCQNRYDQGKPKCDYRLETIPQRDYQLIRITVSETSAKDAGKGQSPFAYIRRRFFKRRLERCRAEMQLVLRTELAPLLDEYGDNYIAFENGLSAGSLSADRQSAEDFRTLLPLPEFDAYRNPKWIRRLLSHAVYADFIVLGDVPCLYEILRGLAPRMKSLLWIAPDLTAKEQTEDFVEDFYQEYGLAIDLRFLPDGSTYSRTVIPDKHFRGPVNVLDFTGDKYVPNFSPPADSVWLDFDSLPEKERRIESRRLKAVYISLQKQWRG